MFASWLQTAVQSEVLRHVGHKGRVRAQMLRQEMSRRWEDVEVVEEMMA